MEILEGKLCVIVCDKVAEEMRISIDEVLPKRKYLETASCAVSLFNNICTAGSAEKSC